MANQRDDSDIPTKEVGPEVPDDTANLTERPKYQKGSSSPLGGRPIGEFAHQGEAALPNALDGGPEGTGNTGAELPGGAQSEFARTSGGQTGGMQNLPGGAAQGAPSGVAGQSVGSVGTIGGSNDNTAGGASPLDNEYGAQHANEPLGADHQHSAKGGSVTAAGSGSTKLGPDQTGFIGANANESGQKALHRDAAEQTTSASATNEEE